jgi:D-beta-D-heptose 7-phosphate kinase / D-beta-D-heptose 1-phosphate adenosyltransferase
MGGRPRVVVVGDLFLDRDVIGSVERFSPDGPVPVVDVVDRRSRPGGAGMAAVLLTADADVRLVAAVADDGAGRALRRLLDAAGVDLIACPTGDPTGVKARIRVGGQTVARIDEGGRRSWPAGVPEEVAASLRGADAVLVSDYGRGCAEHPAVRDLLGGSARRRPVVWDPHPRGGPPVSGVRLATPNATEACRMAELDGEGHGLGLYAAAGARLVRRWESAAVAVTLGERGAVLVDGPGPPLVVPARPVPAADPCGAGDRFAGAAAVALGSGAVA